MSTEMIKFAEQLTDSTKTHDEWLSVIRFGLGSLLENQVLLAHIIAREAERCAKRDGITIEHALGLILCRLNLKLSLA